MAMTAMNSEEEEDGLDQHQRPKRAKAMRSARDVAIPSARARPKRAEEGPAPLVDDEAHLVAVARLHHRHEMADAVDEAHAPRPLADPDLAGEQRVVGGEPVAAALAAPGR